MVEGTRFRLVGLIEWLLAAGCVVGLVAVGAVVSREFRGVRPIVPVLAGAAQPQIVPADVRPGAVSVPMLTMPDGKTVAVGAPASTLDALGPKAASRVGFERLAIGQRETRTYRYSGVEFIVVIADDKIVAIFK